MFPRPRAAGSLTPPPGLVAPELAAESALSPLEEIERRVQDRAKELALDLRTSADQASLRRLVEHEVAEWGAQHQRGLRPFALADPEVVADRVLRNLAGYGPLEPLLADDDVWEVMVNAPDLVFPGQVVAVPTPPAAPR